MPSGYHVWMPNDRRAFIPGGAYFSTVKTELNAPVFGQLAAVRLLGTILREAKGRWPFSIAGMVLLPDPLHAIWSLPPGDDRYSTHWAWIKKGLVKEAGE